ncbi:hypothetical protein EJ103_07335 [Pseudoalteromonas sp. Xi13]|nr:hypothetical protein EJ103_07335 [Pseudoalteromonas sp. Xi13]
MISQALTNKVLKSLSSLNYTYGDNPTRYSFSGTFKESLINNHVDKEVSVISSSVLEVKMKKSDYLSAIITDLFFGKERVERQNQNIQSQIESDQQAAWILVSTYYASYFLACDIAKLSGQFITNLTASNIQSLLSNTVEGNPSSFKSDSDASLAITVSLSEFQNEVCLRLARTAAKPHKVAWHNLYGVFREVKVESNEISLHRFKDIISSDSTKWRLPSTVRNEWNYSAINLYGVKGDKLASDFIKMLKSPGSSIKRFSNNTLHPSEENITSSIGYVYEVLNISYTNIIKKIFNV